MIFPVKPVHSISMGGVTAMKIQAIEIWVVTLIVPPGSFVLNGAVGSKIVIILISSGEWHIAMLGKLRESPEFPDKMSRTMSITFDQQWAVRNSKEILKYKISII